MKEIIAATDFSARSDRALVRAAGLARQFNARLNLVHVVDDDQSLTLCELEKEESERLLQEKLKNPNLDDLSCSMCVVTGDAFVGILQAAEAVSADLIVMGSHRKQLLRDIIVGTTLERVIRTGAYPVLLVNREGERPYRQAIAAIDLSEPSAHALQTALSLGLLGEAQVTVLHAFIAQAMTQLVVGHASQSQIDSYVAAEQQKASEDLVAFLDAQRLGGKDWDYRIEEGAADEVIAAVVSELRADLLVIGTHGRSGLAKVLLGSVAETMLRKLDVDILAVPPLHQ